MGHNTCKSMGRVLSVVRRHFMLFLCSKTNLCVSKLFTTIPFLNAIWISYMIKLIKQNRRSPQT